MSSKGPKKSGNSQYHGYDLSSEQSAAATFSHESNHNTDKEFIIDLKNRREQKPNKGIDPHTNITPNEVRVWQQMHNSNKKKKQ